MHWWLDARCPCWRGCQGPRRLSGLLKNEACCTAPSVTVGGVDPGADGYTVGDRESARAHPGACPIPRKIFKKYVTEFVTLSFSPTVIFSATMTAPKKITAAHLAALNTRKLTKVALAESLGVSVTYIAKNTPKLPPGPIRAQRARTKVLSDTRKAYRTRLAKQVLSGRRSLESAAKEAHCSIRTMYRYLCRLKK
jgi:hypothetical protein